MASLNNPFAAPTAPSMFDVTRRQDLAKKLATNDVYTPNSGFLGALGQALAGAGAGFQNTTAANEAQQGLTGANAALAKALQGGDPAALLQAGGDPFLPQGETDLVGSMLKKKLGLGQVYGNNLPYLGSDQKLHYAAQDSYGNTFDLPAPGGGNWIAPVTYQNTGTNLTPTSKYGGDVGAAPTSAGGAAPIEINNAQAKFNEAWGSALGTDWASAPANLQKEGQLVQTQLAEHKTVDGKIGTALQQIEANPGWMTGFVGDLLKAAPGTPQYDLAQTLQTVKANIGFDTLANMRANSATGGALGQISNMEEQLLQAVNGSLEPGQSAAQLAVNLRDIRQRMADLTSAKQQAMLQDIQRYKAGPQAAPTLGAGAPNIGPGTQTAPPASTSKTIGGVTYTQDANGDWYAN